MLCRGCVVLSIMLSSFYNILLIPTNSRGSTEQSPAQTAFFISLFSLLESLAEKRLPQQISAKKLWEDNAASCCTHWMTQASSTSTVCFDPSFRRPQCYISSPVCCQGEHPGICSPINGVELREEPSWETSFRKVVMAYALVYCTASVQQHSPNLTTYATRLRCICSLTNPSVNHASHQSVLV